MLATIVTPLFTFPKEALVSRLVIGNPGEFLTKIASFNEYLDNSCVPALGKRSSRGGGVYIKMLIPARISGIIIGKGGANIFKLQEESNCRVKISKSNELFPGTEERVCLINGEIHGILQVYDSIQNTFKARPDILNSNMTTDRINEIQLLVPNTTAGSLIGRGGSNIRQIGQETGAKVVISQRVDGVPERLVVVASSSDTARRLAFSQVISKVAEDPHHDSCAEIFYTQPTPDVCLSPLPDGSHHRSESSRYEGHGSDNNPCEVVAGLLKEADGLNPRTIDVLVSIMQERFGLSGDAAVDVLKATDCLVRYGFLSGSPVAMPLSQHPFSHTIRSPSPRRRRHVQIKIPNCAVAALVGSGGRNLAMLESHCQGALIHVSNRDDQNPERTVTIEAHTSIALERAVELINDVVAREGGHRNSHLFG